MKILITSGGTSEAIDRVRSITNHASGQLGKTIAELALSQGHQVTLVTTKAAVKPHPHPRLDIQLISNVESLKESLEPLVKSHQALIHSMAVSDYTPVYMTGLQEVAETENLTDLLTKSNTQAKISSAEEVQVLFLKKTPKLLSFVKQWNPHICLIGFKLLVGVSQAELVAVARESLKKNQADYILANDLEKINSTTHQAYLIDEQESIPAQTKEEIAQLILDKLAEKGEAHG